VQPAKTNPYVEKLNAWLTANNDFGKSGRTGFGIAFPLHKEKGDSFLRVDMMPTRLFKYNGDNWMEVSKDQNTSYINDAYLRFLIERLTHGDIDVDDLTDDEKQDVRVLLDKEKILKNT
jgi:hypothetical protein